MAFHCGAPTRDGSPCQRHVRDLAIRCPQHRNLGGTALHPPRHAMRTIELADPALTAAATAWTPAPADPAARAGAPRDRVTPPAAKESPATAAGSQLTEQATEDDGDLDEAAGPVESAEQTGPIGSRSYLDRERSRRVQAEADDEQEAAGAAAEEMRADAEAGAEPEAAAEPMPADAEPGHSRAKPSAVLTYLAHERIRRLQAELEHSAADAPAATEPEPGTALEPAPEPELGPVPEVAEPISALSYLARRLTAHNQRVESEPEAVPEPEPEPEPEADQAPEPGPRPVEQRPQLRKERALDPDWIGGRPMFRDEAPTRPLPKIEFEPSEGRAPRKPPRVPPMRSVVLNPPAEAPQPAVTPNGFVAEPDPPTLIDRLPPIDHDDLVVPDFLRPDFGAPAAAREPEETRPALPQRKPRPWPRPKAVPDPPTLIDPHPPIAAGPRSPIAAAAPVTPAPHAAARVAPTAPVAATPAAAATPAPAPAPAAAKAAAPAVTRPAPATSTPAPAPPDDITVPDFIVPGFTHPAAKPPLRTVLSTVLGPELWQRCYVEWSTAHCTALARIARTVDGLAPSAGTAVRSTAGAGMRWLGVAREREMLADEVAAAIAHPVGATVSNQARTVRLYGAAICVALNVPLRRCACHRDLDRDVSGELIRLGLEELAGEVS